MSDLNIDVTLSIDPNENDGYPSCVVVSVDEARHHYYERDLCGMVPSFTKPRTLDDCQEFCCSKCGEYMVLQQFGEIEDTPNYCPNCGRRVMGA